MGIFLTALFLSIVHISIAEIYPPIGPLRLPMLIALVTALVTFLMGLMRPMALRVPQLWLLLGFIGAIFFSRLVRGWVGGILPAAMDILPATWVLAFVAFNCRTTGALNFIRICVLLSAAGLMLAGISQYHAAGGKEMPFVMQQSLIVDRETHAFIFLPRLRALGILADPNDFSQFLLCLLPLAFVSWRPGRLMVKVFFVLPLTALTLYSVYLTKSRGAIIGLVVLTALLANARFKLAGGGIAAGGAFALLLLLNFAGGRGLSMSAGGDRLAIWSDGLGAFKQSPIWGVGFGAFADYADLTAHNSFLLCFAELGLLGYFFWLGLIVVTIFQLRIVLAEHSKPGGNEEIKRWAHCVTLSLYTFLATGFFLSRTYSPTLYMLLGMGCALGLMEMERRNDHLMVPANRWAPLTAALSVGSVIMIYVMVRLRAV
jgi:O-antigen ligase